VCVCVPHRQKCVPPPRFHYERTSESGSYPRGKKVNPSQATSKESDGLPDCRAARMSPPTIAADLLRCSCVEAYQLSTKTKLVP